MFSERVCSLYDTKDAKDNHNSNKMSQNKVINQSVYASASNMLYMYPYYDSKYAHATG